MINRFRHISILLAAITSCFFFVACENDINEVDSIGKKEIGVEEGHNIVSILSNGGISKAKLTAPVLLRYQTQVPKVEFPRTLHVDFYDSLKKVESQLFAKYGEYKENQNLIYLRDSIVVFNIKGDTLLTNELYWDQNRQIFYTDAPVTVINTIPVRQKIYGVGMTAKQDLNDIQIRNIDPKSFFVVPDSTYQ